MIKPTVGRVVWVIRPTDSMDIKQPEVGLVTYVHNDRYINVAGFNQNGTPFSLTSLWLVQDDEAKPETDFACWMPYQKGQAAKTDQLEKQAIGSRDPGAVPSTDSAIEREILAKGLTAPRVTPLHIEASIAGEYYFTGANGANTQLPIEEPHLQSLQLLTFCVLVLRNGFTVTGESACASPENFDAKLGRVIARANAVNKIWPLAGYLLKQQLWQEAAHGAHVGHGG